MHERDRQTDGRTDTGPQQRPHFRTALRSKNRERESRRQPTNPGPHGESVVKMECVCVTYASEIQVLPGVCLTAIKGECWALSEVSALLSALLVC